MKKLVLIDSNAIIHRAYHALPQNMATSKGELTNIVYGFATTLIKMLEDIRPDYIAASFDVSKDTFRSEHYKEYKANRVKADQELYDQIPRVKQLLEILDIPIYLKEGFEADDVIGTIVEKNRNYKSEILNKSEIQNSSDKTIQIFIVTGDKDLYQLVSDNVFVYSLKKGLSNIQIIDDKVIKEEYNLEPSDFIDLKALAGDSSDNIPGVPGIGPKTATTLIQTFDTLDNLYKEIESKIPPSSVIPTNLSAVALAKKGAEESSEESAITRSLDSARDDKLSIAEAKIIEAAKALNIKPRILQLLIDNKEQAFMSQHLATIRRDVPIEFELDNAAWGDYDKEKLKDFFVELGFNSILRRFSIDTRPEPKTVSGQKKKEQDTQLKLF